MVIFGLRVGWYTCLGCCGGDGGVEGVFRLLFFNFFYGIYGILVIIYNGFCYFVRIGNRVIDVGVIRIWENFL